MTRFSDSRGLTLCYLRDNGQVLLDDETAGAYAEGEYPSLRQTVSLDVELALYRLTGESGARLPKDETKREQLRALARKTIGAAQA